MNWLKKGPELKLPKLRKPSSGGAGGAGLGIKPPAFVADFYYDLRDRRLLLPLALVLVAIAAVPFLLGGSDPELPPPPAGVGVTTTEPASGSLAVVEATPGLRDYKKRLGDRTPSDPFKPHYTGLPPGVKLETTSSSSSSGGSETLTVEDGSTTVEVETGDSGGSGSGSGGGGSTGGSGDGGSTGGSGDGGDSAQRLELVINAQIRRVETKPDGSEARGELEVRKKVPVLAKLPGKKTPVVTLMGANVRTQRLVFLVSREVKSIKGEFACITRANVCELLEVGLGTLLEFAYEPSGARYELKVTGVDAIPARKRNKAKGSRAPFNRAYSGIAWKDQNFSK